MREPIEHERRKSGARGRPVRLADGRPWLLAEPDFRPSRAGLTSPVVDQALDRFHEQIVLGEDLALADVLDAARTLLVENYELTEEELAELLEVGPGPEAEALAKAVLEAVFGPDRRVRGYVDWVRASLFANGLAPSAIPASAMNDVLTILIATNRTIPPSEFIDACRAARELDSLERLI